MKHVYHLAKSLPPSITASYCSLSWASASTRSGFCSHSPSQTIRREQHLVIPFFGKKKKNQTKQKQAKLSMHRESSFAFKATQSLCTRRNFSVHPAYFTPKNALILQPRKVTRTFKEKDQHLFPPARQLKGLFKHWHANKKIVGEGRGKSCGGLCIFIAQTHRPTLIPLNHMHTLARRLLRTFSGTRSEWL